MRGADDWKWARALAAGIERIALAWPIGEVAGKPFRRIDSGWALMEILNAPNPVEFGIKPTCDDLCEHGTTIEDSLGRRSQIAVLVLSAT